MKIRKPVGISSRSRSTVTLSLIKEDNCLYAVNMQKDGTYAPSNALGEAAFTDIPEGVLSAYFSQSNGSVYLVTASGVYRAARGESSFSRIFSGSPENPFFAEMYMNGFSATIFFSGYDRVADTGAAQDSAQDTRRFYTGAVHCGRFFGRDASDGLKLCWAASHPFDWEEGIYGSGYICLPPEGGNILRLLSYDDRLIAVRERGITVVRAYGDPQNYKVDLSANYLTADYIIEATCAVCGGEIAFCTQRGLYSFDGSDIARLADFGDCGISSPQFAAAVGERYFLSCTHEHIGSCVYCYDGELKKGSVMRAQPSALFAGEDGVYAVCGTQMQKIVAGGAGEWYSRPVNFGGSHAYLKCVRTESDGEASVTISSGGASHTFSGVGAHRVNMAGGEFAFCVQTAAKIVSMTAQAEV